MQLASFVAGGRNRFGIVSRDGLVDLSERTAAPGLRHLLGDPGALERHEGRSVDWSFDDIEWLPPIPDATHIIGIGLNTKSHFAETAAVMQRTPGDYPTHPRLFTRSPLSLVGQSRPVIVPSVSSALDYEGEVALVIGRECRYAPVADALGYVAGVTCGQDGSVRDFQMHTNQVTAGKNFVASGAIGPWLTTVDELGDLVGLTLSVRVNGEPRQSATMEDLIFPFAELISYVSQIFALQPGDVLLTGSPAGIGALDRRWLRPGDEIEVEVSGVGVLRNPVAAEAPDARR
jgi:2-keto-4-pentenoate hydratase/2-oxohepta-3-ene-1,7-dioic acid hydratase in catechol pathway